MLTAIVLILFFLVILVDYLPLRKIANKKEKLWYIALFGVSFCVLLLYSLDVDMPSPSKGIEFIIDALFPNLVR